MAPQGEGHTSNSCSIISVACGEVELKSSCEEEPGWDNTQVLSGGDMDDGKMLGCMRYSQKCAVSAVWIKTAQKKYTADKN